MNFNTLVKYLPLSFLVGIHFRGVKQCCVFLKLCARNMLASVEVSVTRQTWYHYGAVSWNQVKPHGLWGAEATLDFRSNWSLKTPIWGASEVLWRHALMCSHGRYATGRHRDQSESLLICKVPLSQEGEQVSTLLFILSLFNKQARRKEVRPRVYFPW